MSQPYTVAVVGGGIIGLATALALSKRHIARIVVLEAESHVAAHQTGHNSGVIHSGLYYKPGSLKAKNCVLGREAMYQFCAEHAIPHERCGKVVVATEDGQIPALDELERRGHANGLVGVRRISAAELREHEPHVRGVAGLWVPDTGIVDYPKVTETYARLVAEAGHEVRTQSPVVKIEHRAATTIVHTPQGEIECRYLVACAGLQADRVARLAGLDPGLRIVPFRGEYFELVPEKTSLVKNLIYPVPDARFPFLGVHFTRMIRGGVEAGPNAVLSFARHGYGRLPYNLRDTWDLVTYGGFWKLMRRHWQTGVREFYRSLFKAVFVRDLQALIPSLESRDVIPAGCGIRAQTVEPDGSIVDDFRIVSSDRMIHVLNAPSPGATASLAIGQEIAEMACLRFELASHAPRT